MDDSPAGCGLAGLEDNLMEVGASSDCGKLFSQKGCLVVCVCVCLCVCVCV